MSQHTVVVNDCAAVAVVGGPINIRTKASPHGAQNFQRNFDRVTAGLPRTLSPREQDWIETACNLFAIDLACIRGAGDVDWAREIEAYLPVRDPNYWNHLRQPIQNVFSDFTSDRLRLHFVQDDSPDAVPRQRATQFKAHDCVSLVSGGVDSLVGTAQLIADGRRPLGISHAAAAAITRAQTDVDASLTTRWPEFERVGFTARKNGNTFPPPETSQRGRSFLFLAAASLTAAVGGSNEVFINENGVMAIHIPLTAARAGSLSTHTASPTIIERFERVAQDVLNAPISIRNNLLHLTKPEVVNLGLGLALADTLAITVSCWSIGRTNKHCGTCTPCLMRRISFEMHAATDVEYLDDAFDDVEVLQKDFPCDNLTHLVRVVDDLISLSNLELQLRYPELLNGGGQLNLAETIALHRRWASEAASTLYRHPVPAGLR